MGFITDPEAKITGCGGWVKIKDLVLGTGRGFGQMNGRTEKINVSAQTLSASYRDIY